MRRTLLYLFGVLVLSMAMMVLFAWLQHEVGYRAFATGGAVVAAVLTAICVAVTVAELRKKR